MGGIVTVTPAAAIDRTYRLGRLRLGEVHRARSVHIELSGKGVNVARAVALAGMPVSAVLPLGPQGCLLADQEAERNGGDEVLVVVPAFGHTRVNTTILDDSGATTKVNEEAVPLTAEVWNGVVERSLAELGRLSAAWLVLSGTVPRLEGTREDVPVVDLLRAARSAGARVAVDTSGAALRAVVANLDVVSLLKPNTHELAELTGRPLGTLGEVISAARYLRDLGCDTVYVSMGADGALVVDGAGVWHARAGAEVVNTAGAGDASLAGFLVGGMSAAQSEPAPVSAARTAASWGALAVSTETTLLTSVQGAPSADVTADPDPATPLAEPARAGASPAPRRGAGRYLG